MKKYLPGLSAFLLAITAVAFTSIPNSGVKNDSSKFADPCTEANKKWYIINLGCNSQLYFTDLTNPNNYTLSSAQEVAALCAGSECVCAIFACPGSLLGKPNIGSNTSIYADLTNYFYYSLVSLNIALKDPEWARR